VDADGERYRREHRQGDGVRLPVASPFNLPVTVRMLQRRPTCRVDRWDGGTYRRAFATAAGPRLVIMSNRGSVAAPDLWLEIQGGAVSDAVQRDLTLTIRWMLGLDAPPAPTGWFAATEPRFERLAAALTGFRPPGFPTLFEACARVLPYQQLSLDAGTAITGRLVTRFGQPLTVAGVEYFTFPEPAVIARADPEALRQVGLSRTKVVVLQSLAERAMAGELDAEPLRALPTAAAANALQALPGIGPWSAGVILLRGLRRMDVFPPGDVGAARGLPAILGLADKWSPADASAYAERFGDRRGYLYFFGLGAQLQARGLLDPPGTP
jgi:DNA-3-methyladenine glycosylase II